MHLVVLHLKKKDEIKIEVLFAPSTMHHIQGQGRKEVEDDRKKKKRQEVETSKLKSKLQLFISAMLVKLKLYPNFK